jgi:hypothetical protein
MKGDFKVPKNLAEKIAHMYTSEIITNSDDGTLDYDSTIDRIAERIMLDYEDDKIIKMFGQYIENPEKMSIWLRNYIPELYEILLQMNNEL